MPLRILSLALTLIYPFIVWWGLNRFGLFFLACFMVALAALRYILDKKNTSLVMMLVCIFLAGSACALKDATTLKLYPVLMNGVMLFIFGSSFFEQETIIERFARLSDPELSDDGIRYTRRLTAIWCVFFVLNGAVALWTVFCASDWIWALYNGGIAYVLMSCLFVGEWLYRKLILKI